MPGTGPALTVPLAASAVQPPFPGCGERFGQFGDEPVQVVAGDSSKDRMRQGRTGLLDRHNQQTVRPATVSIKPTRRSHQHTTIDPQVVNYPALLRREALCHISNAIGRNLEGGFWV